MAAHEETLERRLARLREYDRSGFYAGDASATGEDESGAITVTVDPTDRVSLVQLNGSGEAVRTPDELARAVEEAFRVARIKRLNALVPPRRKEGEMPVAQKPASPTIHTVENWMGTGRQRSEQDRRAARLAAQSGATAPTDFGPTTGVSDNECVTVTLDIASSHGTVQADPGWLANAAASKIGEAVTQAFIAAYRKRDGS